MVKPVHYWLRSLQFTATFCRYCREREERAPPLQMDFGGGKMRFARAVHGLS
jgi:hypothetical protein